MQNTTLQNTTLQNTTLLNYILAHSDCQGPYTQIFIVEFSSAFDMIISDIIHYKLSQLSVPTSTCDWTSSFLINREQQLKLGIFTSSTHTAPVPPMDVCSPRCSFQCTLLTILLWTHLLLPKDLLCQFYRDPNESILFSPVAVWYNLPSGPVHISCQKWVRELHPSYRLFRLLPSGR